MSHSRTLALCYHAISESWPCVLAVGADELEAQLRRLLERGYVAATFTEAVHSPPARRTLAVTFDDAYRSVHEHALPVLERLGIPATVFVPTAFAGSEEPMSWPGIEHWHGTPHERELVPMSWSELGELRERGWEIGSHTRTHPRLTALGDAELAGELSGSRAECERGLGEPCRSVAYPYGDEDERVARAAAEAGYEAGAALPDRFTDADPMRAARIGVYRGDGTRRLGLKAAPPVLALRRTRAWPILAGLRRPRRD